VLVALIIPDALTLVGMLMLGNLMKEAVSWSAGQDSRNELLNIVTIFLGVTVGATATLQFPDNSNLMIIGLGIVAFGIGTASGVLLGRFMYFISGGKVNPLIGSAGVSAVPMAARVSRGRSGGESKQFSC
jgi:oxaloacetate decarboxylase beta subunit